MNLGVGAHVAAEGEEGFDALEHRAGPADKLTR